MVRCAAIPPPRIRGSRRSIRDELPELSLEISVLGPLEPIEPPARGLHGRRARARRRAGSRRGLLLPQVATEWGWDGEQFLAPDLREGRPAARRLAARRRSVFRFEAEVFGD